MQAKLAVVVVVVVVTTVKTKAKATGSGIQWFSDHKKMKDSEPENFL